MPKSLLILFQDNLFAYSNSLLVGLLCSRGDAGGKATKEMFLELLTQSIQRVYIYFFKYLLIFACTGSLLMGKDFL